jgi:hypothetical protein
VSFTCGTKDTGGGGSGAPLAKAGGGRDARDARGGGPVRVCGGVESVACGPRFGGHGPAALGRP